MRVQRLAALVSLALLATIVAPVAAQQTPGGAAADRYIVVLHDSVSRPAEAAAEMGRQHGVEVGFIYQHAFKGFAAAIPAGRVAALQRDPRVAWVEADRLFTISVDPGYETGVARIESDRNTAFGAGGPNWASTAPVIAVLDTGVSHSDINVVRRYDCTGGGPFRSSCTLGAGEDGYGHGTHVAGTAAATTNGAGVIGVAPGAPVWSIKVLSDSGSGYTSWIAAGIDVTAANSATVAVANMSLGGSGSDDGNCGNSNNDAMHKAICSAVNTGVVYAVAAGNSSANAAKYVPASYDEVITVSAVADFNGRGGGGSAPTCRGDVDDTFADFSNFGADVDISAPGVCITSTWNDGGLNEISGTSMASPHVAGVAAMYIAKNGKPTNKAGALAVRDALVSAGYPQSDAACGFSGDPDSFAEPLVNADAVNVGGTGAACTSDSTDGGGATNNPPIAENVSASGDEDTVISWTPSVSDLDAGETLTCSIATQPTNGSAGVTSNCSGGSYTPDLNHNGTDSFTYRVSDGSATHDGTVSVTINPVNDAPVAVDDAYSTPTGTTLNVVAPGVLANDSDVDGDPISAVAASGSTSAGGSFSLSNDGSLTYAPPSSTFTGPDSFTYTVSDGSLTATGRVTISVGSVMTISSLTGSSTNQGRAWSAIVTITIADGDGLGVEGASVSGTWTYNGTSFAATCTTGETGQCTVDLTGIPKRFGSVTFTTSIVDDGGAHDWDDINQSEIVSKP